MMTKINANCFLFDKKKVEAEIPTDDIPARICFLAEQVSTIRECVKDGTSEINPDRCIVYMKDGHSMEIDMSYDDTYMQVFAE